MRNFDCDIIASEISQEMARFHKKLFGKGPDRVEVLVRNKLVVVRAQGVLTIIEANLLQSDNGEKTILEIRCTLLETFKSVILNNIHSILGSKFNEVMSELLIDDDELLMVFC